MEHIETFIVCMLLAAPTILCIITLSEVLAFKRLMLKYLNTQNRAISTLIDAQRVTMNTASNIYSIVMEERE